MRHHIFTTIATWALLLPSLADAECNRARMYEWANNYVEAQSLGFVGYMDGASDEFQYMENNKTMEITLGVLRLMLRIDHNRTIADDEACASYTEIISTDPKQPYVIGTQIRHNADDMTAYLIDSVVSTTGSWLFNARETLRWAEAEDWGVIEEGARDSREALKNAADAYLDMWHNASAIDAVPWGTPCARLEGGAYTGNGSETDSCKPGIPTNNTQAPNSARRYVIDPSFGSINVLNVFEHLDNAPDSHEFRMENGKLRYIHTITDARSDALGPPGSTFNG